MNGMASPDIAAPSCVGGMAYGTMIRGVADQGSMGEAEVRHRSHRMRDGSHGMRKMMTLIAPLTCKYCRARHQRRRRSVILLAEFLPSE